MTASTLAMSSAIKRRTAAVEESSTGDAGWQVGVAFALLGLGQQSDGEVMEIHGPEQGRIIEIATHASMRSRQKSIVAML